MYISTECSVSRSFSPAFPSPLGVGFQCHSKQRGREAFLLLAAARMTPRVYPPPVPPPPVTLPATSGRPKSSEPRSRPRVLPVARRTLTMCTVAPGGLLPHIRAIHDDASR